MWAKSLVHSADATIPSAVSSSGAPGTPRYSSTRRVIRTTTGPATCGSRATAEQAAEHASNRASLGACSCHRAFRNGSKYFALGVG